MSFLKKNWKIAKPILKEFKVKAKNLKLIARTNEDLRVISSHLQDSIAGTDNIANLQKFGFDKHLKYPFNISNWINY